jgi:radical SAM-linked protein
MRITFTKEGATRYISHLDLARAVERALNRAGLPVAYSQGFNRRPRLSLAAALPLGYTSEAEMADIWLTEHVSASLFAARLAASMPPGIGIKMVGEVPLNSPSIQQQMAESIYEVRFLDPIDEATLQDRVTDLMAAESIMREKVRGKGNKPQVIDLRPLIVAMDVRRDEDGELRLTLRLVQTASQTGRPDDVIAALGVDPLNTRVHRVGLSLASSDPQSSAA